MPLSQPVHETATYRFDDTRGCVMQFWPPDDEHMCSKHVEAWNKLIVKQKFCASSWLITEINILRCTVSKTSKTSTCFLSLRNENCEREEVMICAGLSCIQVAPSLYIWLFCLKKYIKYANKCVTFQLQGYSCHFPGVFLGDCYWAHHVHKSFYCVIIPSGGWTCPVLVWSRSAVWVSCWCTSVFFYHQLHKHFHFLLSVCMTVVLLLEFNSSVTCVNVMDAIKVLFIHQLPYVCCTVWQ